VDVALARVGEGFGLGLARQMDEGAPRLGRDALTGRHGQSLIGLSDTRF